MADIKLDRNHVAVEGVLRVEGNGLQMGTPVNLRITSGGPHTRVAVGSAQKPAKVELTGTGGKAFLHVDGLMRSAKVDTAKLSIGGADLLARIADLERRIAALERR
jgi:hypothetical protein